MPKYLSTAQVVEATGLDRSALLRAEQRGDLGTVQRTGGGHRRYTREQVDALGEAAPAKDAGGKKQFPEQKGRRLHYQELGTTGLTRFGGQIWEEKLKELRGRAGRLQYREMRMNSPVVAAVFFGIVSSLKEPSVRVATASDKPADREAGEFVDSCLYDMSFSWKDTLDLILNPFLEQGFAVPEIVYKRRLGSNPPPHFPQHFLPHDHPGYEPPSPSRHDDGRDGWRKFAPRPAESLAEGQEWIFDSHGGVRGINQAPDVIGGQVQPLVAEHVELEPEEQAPSVYSVPIEKLLHFRTTLHPGNNPEGMALALDTPIPTPDGWNIIGDLKVGDKVYGGDGKIRYVVAISEIWKQRPVYEIEFTSGQKITADENHLWQITTAHDRHKNKNLQIWTSKQIYKEVTRTDKKQKASICVGPSPVLDAIDIPLPLDPYILGYWLGDGCLRKGEFAVHIDDYPELAENVRKAGFSIKHDGDRGASTKGLRARLRFIGVVDFKHIPEIYMRAAPYQRLALLQGLMDSDGSSNHNCGKKDRASKFFNSNKVLFNQTCELIRSLGGRPHVRLLKKPGDICGTINGKQIIQRKQLYEASFFLDYPCHRLKRKLKLQVKNPSLRAKSYFVREIKLVEEQDTICIEVDSPDHLFLAGEGCIPTHNSILRPAYLPYFYAHQMMEIEGIGAERDLGGIPVIYLGEGTTLGEDADSDWSMSKQIVTSLRSDEQAGVVFPHQKLDSQGRGILLELLSTGGRRAWDVGSIIERYEKRIALSALSQFLMLGMEQVGSYALSRHQGDLFVLAVQAFLDTIADVINRHGIPRLMERNIFPGISGDPVLTFSPVGVPKLEEVAEFVNRLAERELLTPDPELERHLRQLGGLPQPVVEVQETPEAGTGQARDAEKTALLLRRISLAIEPLEELGALEPGEGAALLSPLVDELRVSLGGGGTTGDSFEERVGEASRRLREDVQAGETVAKAGRNYVDRILKKKNLGQTLTDELERKLDAAWDEATGRIAKGEPSVLVLSDYEKEAAALMETYYKRAFEAGLPPDEQDDGGLVAAGLAAALALLSKFMLTLGSQLAGLLPQQAADLMSRRRARALMYSGGAWSLYNQAKMVGAGPDEIWEWSGPVDQNSCTVCAEEVKAGPRPLHQIKRFPVRDSQCMSNCRHELVRRKDLET